MNSNLKEAVFKRRPRYPGRNPRRFEEKYKEHDPDRYPETSEKVKNSGKTPAGTHRPVLLEEVIGVLSPRPTQVGVDATLGWGGHAEEILARLVPGGRLLALDVDPLERAKTEARLRARGLDESVLIIRGTNFAGLLGVLEREGLGPVDFVFADLGVSSMQLDDPARGFSFKTDGPLDLRLNPERGQPASGLITRIPVLRLERLLVENSDEPHAARIATAIIEAREKAPVVTTLALSRVVAAALSEQSPEEIKKTLARVFQALRIEVNGEMSALTSFLRDLPGCLKPGGRIAVLTFHSGEDRLVKKAFQDGFRRGIYGEAARRVITPSAGEKFSNPRSSPAKLRWAVRA